MSMDVGGKKKGPRSDINVTPLVDIVLVLLIIFMVLTPTMLKNLAATVPEKADDQPQTAVADSAIVVEYTAKRELTVNLEPVSVEGLQDKLIERLKAQRQKAVFFKAEDDAPYGEVVRLLDIARGSGAQTLAVVTE
jgi:biopolymer transport protein TolR